MRLAFFGTPEEAVPILEAVAGIAEVAIVVTRVDKPQGRSGRLIPPPVKVAAAELGLAVAQPSRMAELAGLVEGVDAAVVAAFGRIVPGPALAVPRAGFVNVHYSLLPRWRGASPVVRAVLAGDATTGVTLMQMDEGLDTGPILATAETPIDPAETAGELTMRLADLGADLVRRRLADIVAGEVPVTPQDDLGATAAAKVTVEEAFLDPLRHRAGPLVRAVLAYNPRPGAWGVVDGERLKVWRAAPSADSGPEPGVAQRQGGRVLLGTADGAVELLEVQPPGRPSMAAAAWMNGRRGEPARFTVPSPT